MRGLASPHPFLGAICGMCYAGFAGTVAPCVMFPSGVVWPGMSRIMADMDQKDSTHCALCALLPFGSGVFKSVYWCSCTSRCISFGCGRPFCLFHGRYSCSSWKRLSCPLCATTMPFSRLSWRFHRCSSWARFSCPWCYDRQCRSIEILQVQFVDKVFTPVVRNAGVMMVQTVQNSVGILQAQFVDKVFMPVVCNDCELVVQTVQ